jgi:hypothetical protein
LDVDHIVPKSSGGTSDYDNLAFTCAQCNRFKHTWDPRPSALSDSREVLLQVVREYIGAIRAQKQLELEETRRIVESVTSPLQSQRAERQP